MAEDKHRVPGGVVGFPVGGADPSPAQMGNISSDVIGQLNAMAKEAQGLGDPRQETLFALEAEAQRIRHEALWAFARSFALGAVGGTVAWMLFRRWL